MELELREIHIPFRFRYGHARKQHQGLEAIVCLARDDEGRVGLGEAVPRTYVTGETCASIWEEFCSLIALPELRGMSVEGLSERRLAMAREWPGGFPSCACCAIDTALLSLQARRNEHSVCKLLGGQLPQTLVYSASIGISNKPKLIATLLLYRALGLKHFKVKVGDAEDFARIRLIRSILGRDVSLFADANAHWDPESAIRNIESLAEQGVWAVEEPLLPLREASRSASRVDRFSVLDESHYEQYRRLRSRSPLPLIADESLICLASLQRIVDHEAFDILNIRLSKCGGPLLAAEMVRIARREQLQFSIGAMVGETPILAAAGSQFGAAFLDHRYIQGHSHGLLHQVRFAHGEPKIRRGGRLLVSEVSGLGVQLDESRLDSITVRREKLDL